MLGDQHTSLVYAPGVLHSLICNNQGWIHEYFLRRGGGGGGGVNTRGIYMTSGADLEPKVEGGPEKGMLALSAEAVAFLS